MENETETKGSQGNVVSLVEHSNRATHSTLPYILDKAKQMHEDGVLAGNRTLILHNNLDETEDELRMLVSGFTPAEAVSILNRALYKFLSALEGREDGEDE